VINGGDVRLQNFHLARDGETGAFMVLNNATLESYAGNLDDYLASGKPFLTIDPTATATFVGNVINTPESQMPDDSKPNVTALGNLRYDALMTGTSSDWTDGSGDRTWNKASNWDNGVPGASVRATVAVTGPIIGTGVSAAAGSLSVDDMVDVTGGSVTVTYWLALGEADGANGTLTVSAGSVSVGSDLYVGLNGTGAVQLNGGTLNVGSLVMTGSGILDMEDGVLIIAGDATAMVNAYVSNGWITAYGGVGMALVDYNVSTAGKTTVTASAPVPGYTVWAAGWGVDIGADTNDYDGDVQNNFYEYVLNGDPTNAAVGGVSPVLINVNGERLYIHLQRNDDAGLLYSVETSTNLVSNAWTNSGYSVFGTNTMGGGTFYDVVTNSISTAGNQLFIRLLISGQ
jgi:hypothetical protein